MAHRRQATDRQRKRILRLHQRGYNGKEIARNVNLHSSTIYTVLKAERERLVEIQKEKENEDDSEDDPSDFAHLASLADREEYRWHRERTTKQREENR